MEDRLARAYQCSEREEHDKVINILNRMICEECATGETYLFLADTFSVQEKHSSASEHYEKVIALTSGKKGPEDIKMNLVAKMELVFNLLDEIQADSETLQATKGDDGLSERLEYLFTQAPFADLNRNNE